MTRDSGPWNDQVGLKCVGRFTSLQVWMLEKIYSLITGFVIILKVTGKAKTESK